MSTIQAVIIAFAIVISATVVVAVTPAPAPAPALAPAPAPAAAVTAEAASPPAFQISSGGHNAAFILNTRTGAVTICAGPAGTSLAKCQAIGKAE